MGKSTNEITIFNNYLCMFTRPGKWTISHSNQRIPWESHGGIRSSRPCEWVSRQNPELFSWGKRPSPNLWQNEECNLTRVHVYYIYLSSYLSILSCLVLSHLILSYLILSIYLSIYLEIYPSLSLYIYISILIPIILSLYIKLFGPSKTKDVGEMLLHPHGTWESFPRSNGGNFLDFPSEKTGLFPSSSG